MRLAIVGRPNSGKSTLLNALTGYERSVVSDVPGTTRDSIDETVVFHKSLIQVIDTAGIRRKKHDLENIEYYSLTRTIESIRRCDVAVHLIDAVQGLTETDKKISDEILKAKKPILIAINKWDAVEKDERTFDEYREKLRFKFYRTGDFPLISISAKDKTRIHKLLVTAMDLHGRASTSIETPRLNRFIEGLQKSGRLPQLGHKIKVLYATQVNAGPPEFLFFVNKKENFRVEAVRYFEKELRREFNLSGVPISIRIEDRTKKK
jgi:GTP-binding protein